MNCFSCKVPGEIIVGEGKLMELGTYIKPLGRRCFLAVDPFFRERGLSDEIAATLRKKGIDTIMFSKIKPNPDCRDVDEGAEICSAEKSAVVLGLGGGSAIDTGKAIAVVAKNGGSSWDYVHKVDREARRIEDALPIIAVPTTAGTGTEATPYAVLSNPKVREKGTIVHTKCFPAFALVDPSLMTSMPPSLTALTGMDALSHCIEAFLANVGTPFSRMVSAEGIRTITRYLPEAYANGNNMRAREAIAWGSILGGISIGHAGVGLPHALGQPVGGIVGAPHGASVAACLAEAVEFAFMSSFDLFAELSVCFDENAKVLPFYVRAERSVELVKRFFKYLDLNVKYSDYGMKESDIDKAVEVVFGGYGDNVRNFPRIAAPDDVRRLYVKCL